MAQQPEEYFILLYNVDDRELEIKPYGRDADAAVEAYSAYERLHRDDQIEVVMVGADSLDTIKKTHSHYFARTEVELFDQFLAELGAD